jgi:cbb3-type cytochrome oxidase subunit 3
MVVLGTVVLGLTLVVIIALAAGIAHVYRKKETK